LKYKNAEKKEVRSGAKMSLVVMNEENLDKSTLFDIRKPIRRGTVANFSPTYGTMNGL
jgi:hypothetical protein